MRLAARLRALVLVLLFVGTGVVAPLLDGVLFHRVAEPTRPHVEMRDNPACHAEWCVLSLYQATSSAGPAVVVGPPLFTPITSSLFRLPPSFPHPVDRPGQLRSRAPPSLLV